MPLAHYFCEKRKARKGEAMDVLWAPWRMEYILCEKGKGCIFCTKLAEQNDEKNLILYRGKTAFIIMNFYPYNNGHLMVVPNRHTANLADLSEVERLELMTLMRNGVAALQTTISPHGFNIGMNLGKVAGAGVDDHLHFHIVPRWEGDTNYMPIVGHTKVVSEGLQETWQRLKAVLGKKV